MVQRPPSKAGSSGHGFDEPHQQDSVRSSTKGGNSSRRGLEWSLRSLHKIDNSAQHFLQNYYSGDSDDDMDDEGRALAGEDAEDQTAYDIFKGKADTKNNKTKNNNHSVWSVLSAPLRTGIVDGRRVVFELRTDVNQKPTTDRRERMHRPNHTIHASESPRETRLRFWMMHFSVSHLSVAFLAAFVAMNVVFAGFFYSLPETCCGDASLTFGQVFSFAVQTSTTIGYGSLSPQGHVANFLVVILSYMSTLMNTLFAGLLFTKFVTPVINIQCSEVMTLCNVNGVPCLSIRIGNADGRLNPMTDINVRLTYSYQIPYTDHRGQQNFFRQTEELRLLSNRQHGLEEVWTLRHVLDETSPLFGLNFTEHPANKIYVFTLSIDAVQDLSKSSVNIQTNYALEDILIGHTFKDMLSLDLETLVATSDFSKISDTESYPVWYPALAGVYGNPAVEAALNGASTTTT